MMEKPKIHSKPENKGKFTKHCEGKVTNECIEEGLASKSEAVRKQAQFAKMPENGNIKKSLSNC